MRRIRQVGDQEDPYDRILVAIAALLVCAALVILVFVRKGHP